MASRRRSQNVDDEITLSAKQRNSWDDGVRRCAGHPHRGRASRGVLVGIGVTQPRHVAGRPSPSHLAQLSLRVPLSGLRFGRRVRRVVLEEPPQLHGNGSTSVEFFSAATDDGRSTAAATRPGDRPWSRRPGPAVRSLQFAVRRDHPSRRSRSASAAGTSTVSWSPTGSPSSTESGTHDAQRAPAVDRGHHTPVVACAAAGDHENGRCPGRRSRAGTAGHG